MKEYSFLLVLFGTVISLVAAALIIAGSPTFGVDFAPSSSVRARGYTKDLFLIQLKKPVQYLNNGFNYTVELHRQNQPALTCAASTTSFFNGDGIRLRINSNFKAYAYIVLARGSTGKQTVLYPSPQVPGNNVIEPNHECTIPSQGLIRFDENPGIEKLLFILSRNPIDLNRVLSTQTSIPITDDVANAGSEGILISNEIGAGGTVGPTYVVKSDPSKVVFVELSLNHVSPPTAITGTRTTSSTAPLPSTAAIAPATVTSTVTSTPNAVSALPVSATPATPSVSGTSAAPSTTRTTASQFNRPVTDKWAVLIALSKYKESSMNLKAPTKDAEAFANFLLDDAGFAPSHIIKIYDKEATRENIMDKLDQLGSRVRPDDLVVVYANCHGSSTTKRGENYLLLWDWTGSFKKQLLMQDLSATLKERLHSERIVVIVQACHSGFVKDAGVLSAEAVSTDLQGLGRIVVSACMGDESSWVYPRGGIFTRALIPNLRKYPKLKEALTQTRDEVIELTERKPEDKQMHPVIKYDLWLGDDAVLMVKPTDPQP